MLDVIEIDGASNNGVENVRELIEKARFEPTQWKYKIYIIDEVHMLSTGAFNALLKTLEEPPSHVKFILATTEIEKVPETIRSRSLRFDFRKISETDIVKRLEFVVKSEGIKADNEALCIIAKAARGWLRDALTLLEQNTISWVLEAEYVRSNLSLIEENIIENIIETLKEEDSGKIEKTLEKLSERHIDVRSFFDQMLYALRDKMFEHLNDSLFGTYESIFRVFESAYTKIKVIPDGFLLIEITLIRAVKRNEWMNDTGKSILWEKRGLSEMKPSSADSWKDTLSESWMISGGKKTSRKKDENSEMISEVNSERVWLPTKTFDTFSHENTGRDVSDKQQSEEQTSQTPFSYPRLLQIIKERRPALVTDLKLARFKQNERELMLIFSKKWNYDRVNTPAATGIISEIASELFSGTWSIVCSLEEWVISPIVDEVF